MVPQNCWISNSLTKTIMALELEVILIFSSSKVLSLHQMQTHLSFTPSAIYFIPNLL